MVIGYSQLRDLDTSKLTASADTATVVGKDVESRAGEIADLVRGGGVTWSGVDAEAQNALLGTFPAPLQAAGGVFKAAAGTLDTLVAELEGAKSDVHRAIASFPEHRVADDGAVSWPPSPDAATEARLREQARELHSLLMTAIERADAADTLAATQLAGRNPNGGNGPVPVTLPDGSVYLATGDEADQVTVSNNAEGGLVATVDGKEFTFDAGTKLTVDGQGGDDRIDIAEDVKEDVTALGGDDNDTINGSDKGDVIHGGEGDDVIDGRGGDDAVLGGDGRNTLRGGDGNDAIVGGDDPDEIHGGDGDDRVYAKGNEDDGDPRTVDYDVVYGNDGDDTIHGGDGKDRIAGGAGGDTVHGGGADDYIDGQTGDDELHGEDGADVVYGLDGEDTMTGGNGDDYLEGGQHDDRIDGGVGDDTISGGYGDDTLSGGVGDDVFYGGHGRDTIDGGGGGDDRAHVQPEDVITKDRYGFDTAARTDVEISDNADVYDVQGTPDFVARVKADLDMMAASPTGQQLLDAQNADLGGLDDILQPGQNGLVIKEMALDPSDPDQDEPHELDNGFANSHEDDWSNTKAEITYNPAMRLDDGGSTPATVLYHEMAHTYDFTHGLYDPEPHTGGVDDGVKKEERNTVGLPIDHDDDPGTPMQRPDNHPWAMTENAMRDEHGRPLRETYR